jgi:hypothetical protein
MMPNYKLFLVLVSTLLASELAIGCKQKSAKSPRVERKALVSCRVPSGCNGYKVFLGQPYDSVTQRVHLTYNYEAEDSLGNKSNQYFDDSVPALMVNGVVAKPIANFFFVKRKGQLVLGAIDVFYSCDVHKEESPANYKLVLSKIRNNFTLASWGDDCFYKSYTIKEDENGITVTYSLGYRD